MRMAERDFAKAYAERAGMSALARRDWATFERAVGAERKTADEAHEYLMSLIPPVERPIAPNEWRALMADVKVIADKIRAEERRTGT